MNPEASYVCEFCGEEIVVTVELTGGQEQEYVEDCPVCCRPHLLHVFLDPDGAVQIRAEAESH